MEFVFDYEAMLEMVKNPAIGLQILASFTGFNAILGVILARKQGAVIREYLTNFLWTRGIEQLLPIGLAGVAAVYGNMPWFLVIYLTGAAFMLYDLTGDIKDKALLLWRGKQQG